MRELFSFIFDKLTDPLGLPIAAWKEWLILLVLGELAYIIAFRVVGDMYDSGDIFTRIGGSFFHWISGVEWIEKIPEGWNAVPLKTLFDFGKGLPITKENLVEEGIPVISYGQIHAKWNSGVTIHEELKRFVNKEYLETNPSCLVKKGDFIIADTSEDREGCGNAAYVDTDDTIFAGYHTVILISKKPNVDNKYLAYLFLTDAWRSQLRKRVSGIKVFSVSRKFLSETSVLIPDNALPNKSENYLIYICSQYGTGQEE